MPATASMHEILAAVAPCFPLLARIMRVAADGGDPLHAERELRSYEGRHLLRAVLTPDMRQTMIAELERAVDTAICEEHYDEADSACSVFQRVAALLS